MKRLFLLTIVLLTANILYLGCTPATKPITTLESKTPVIKVDSPAIGVSWEEKWMGILAQAKKEGIVSIYTTWKSPVNVALTQAFKQKYGIGLEFSPFSRGQEILVKTQAEQRAGLYMADIFGTGATAILTPLMKPAGLLGSMKQLIILPEVIDEKAWRGNSIPFMDEDNDAIRVIGTVARGVAYNSENIKEGEIRSIKDLLKSQYKGKITINDPTVGGMTNVFLTNLSLNLWNETETVNLLSKLVKEQEAVIQRDNRLHAESVARGKYYIGVGPQAEVTAELISLGATIRLATLVEDNCIVASTGGIGIPTKFAHPNAAIVFLNWFLTKEGQSLFATNFGSPSTRLDASTEGVNPLFIPEPGKKYYTETPEFLQGKESWLKTAKAVIE